MRGALLVGLMVLVSGMLGAQAAFGCSCVGPDSEDPREELANADAAAFVEALERRMENEQRAVYRMRVIERFKGDIGDEIEVVTRAGGASCGLGMAVGEQSGLLLGRDAEGNWTSGSCSQRSRERLRNGMQAPRPQSSGPIRLLIGGQFGPNRIGALDARGRLVRMGAGEDRVGGIAPCPGGRRVIEVVSSRSGRYSLAVRDMATLEVRRTHDLALSQRVAGDYLYGIEHPTGVRCESADGRVALLATGGEEGSRLILVTGGAEDTLWRTEGPASPLVFGGRYGWVQAEGRLLRVDLHTGRSRALGAPTPEEPVAVSPDGRRLISVQRELHGTPRGRGRFSLLDARTGRSMRVLPLADAVDAHWLGRHDLVLRTDRKLHFMDDRWRVRRTVKFGLAPAVVADGRLLLVSVGVLVTYGRDGNAVGAPQPLFSRVAYALAVLPKPARKRARSARACAWRGLRPPAIT
jgi:hypothetical protein